MKVFKFSTDFKFFLMSQIPVLNYRGPLFRGFNLNISSSFLRLLIFIPGPQTQDYTIFYSTQQVNLNWLKVESRKEAVITKAQMANIHITKYTVAAVTERKSIIRRKGDILDCTAKARQNMVNFCSRSLTKAFKDDPTFAIYPS